MKEYLDIREINGYSIQRTPFHAGDESREPFSCLVYIGLPDNPQFLGVQDPQALAQHILRSRGPSGANSEYLLMLEDALDNLDEASGDGHVKDLANRIRLLQRESSGESMDDIAGDQKRRNLPEMKAPDKHER